MKKYPDFWHVIVGTGSAGAFLAFIVVALVCSFVSLLIESSNRDITSTTSPVQFSWTFLFGSNLRRIIANILLIPIAIRLVYSSVSTEQMVILSVGIGAGFDRLFMWFKNIGVLSNEKLAEKINEKLENKS